VAKVLVTGADGFIGSHLVERLYYLGFDVKAMVQYNSFNSWGWLDRGPEEVRNNIEVFSGDIRDLNCIKSALVGCSSVIHLAALVAIPYSYYSPSSYIDTNVIGTLNIVQCARDLNLEVVVHTSTSEVYGTAKFVPMTEDHPLQGQSPYSASKIGADQIARSFYLSFGTPVITLRPFNTYGPRQSARAVIPSIIIQLLSGNGAIKLGALHPTRDFNYIDDTVNAFVSALNSKDAFGEVINIGSNYEINIKNTALAIAKIIGVDIEFKEESQRLRPIKSEVERLYSDNSKAKDILKWTPEYGDLKGLERGLAKTIDWFSKPENLSSYKLNQYNI
jgi:NAD dependent epimerase/dehydratase